MLAREGSECNQGPKSTYKPYVNISLGRRNFVVVLENSTSREEKEHSTISFLFICPYMQHQWPIGMKNPIKNTNCTYLLLQLKDFFPFRQRVVPQIVNQAFGTSKGSVVEEGTSLWCVEISESINKEVAQLLFVSMIISTLVTIKQPYKDLC